MYTKEEREGILWEFHQSGMSVAEARAVPQRVEPETVAAHGGGGRARRTRDARQGLPHALRPRRDSASLGFTGSTNTRPNPTSANAPAKPA
jgi:hypothetical protein